MSTEISPPSALHQTPAVSGLQVVVRDETPFLPKVAFTLITIASFAGVLFVSTHGQLTAGQIFLRWISLWSLGLSGGFAAWRIFYLRAAAPRDRGDTARQGEIQAIGALTETALARALLVGRWTAPITAVGAIGVLTTPYLNSEKVLKWSLFATLIALTVSLIIGVTSRSNAWAAFIFSMASLIMWALADAGAGWDFVIRALHLIAFSLWLGGALWNIAVQMPAGRAHPNLDAVVAGAQQLDRFRWVVRFVLPTIIATGVVMALNYRMLPFEWWTSFPGVLIPGKALTIVALVVVFITCPLFRHCSPVQGVCNLDDLEE